MCTIAFIRGDIGCAPIASNPTLIAGKVCLKRPKPLLPIGAATGRTSSYSQSWISCLDDKDPCGCRFMNSTSCRANISKLPTLVTDYRISEEEQSSLEADTVYGWPTRLSWPKFHRKPDFVMNSTKLSSARTDGIAQSTLQRVDTALLHPCPAPTPICGHPK